MANLTPEQEELARKNHSSCSSLVEAAHRAKTKCVLSEQTDEKVRGEIAEEIWATIHSNRTCSFVQYAERYPDETKGYYDLVSFFSLQIQAARENGKQEVIEWMEQEQKRHSGKKPLGPSFDAVLTHYHNHKNISLDGGKP
jgi:hypothetical protein